MFEQHTDSRKRNSTLVYIDNLNNSPVPAISLSKYLSGLGFKPEEIQTLSREPKD